MQIMGLLGIYFEAAVVFVTKLSLLFRFRLALAVLWLFIYWHRKRQKYLLICEKISDSNKEYDSK